MPTDADADRIDAIRWLAERMGLEPAPEEGVWLATSMGKVLRLPMHLDATLKAVLTDGSGCGSVGSTAPADPSPDV